MKSKFNSFEECLTEEIREGLFEKHQIDEDWKTATRIQKIDNGFEAQEKVISISGVKWKEFLDRCSEKSIFSPKEMEILAIATRIPKVVPSEKQSFVLIGLLERAKDEGIIMNQ